MCEKGNVLDFSGVWTTMKEDMNISRRTWIAAIKLAVVMSTIAAIAAIGLSTLGQIPDEAIIAIVAIVAFAVSWVQTGRVRSAAIPLRSSIPQRVTFHAH